MRALQDLRRAGELRGNIGKVALKLRAANLQVGVLATKVVGFTDRHDRFVPRKPKMSGNGGRGREPVERGSVSKKRGFKAGVVEVDMTSFRAAACAGAEGRSARHT